ncbi:MAG: signal peptide protein [Ramlibacter sp.]|nr:signal peptide protein [Ramlibacter sp.]
MKIARLVAGFTLAVAGMLAQAAPSQLSPAEARHLLRRTGFAPAQAEVDQVVGQSAERAVGDIVAKAKVALTLHPPPAFVTAVAPSPPRLLETREQRQEWRRRQLAEGLEMKTWWVREMIESPAPLAERMTLFWHGHFATSQQKVVRAQAMWRQQQLLRAQGLGNFRILLHGVAKDPAMLAYLDGAISRKEAPNENFAREVMELFTLGEATQGGGYSEQDIREAARAFTGWSIDRDDFSFRLRPAFHDGGSKTVFGRSGDFDGDAVIDLMLDQPAAARFLTAKLWKEFVSPIPEGREFDAIAAHFRASGYDIATVVRELLLSDAFWAESNRGSLVKSPVELVVGAVRQFGVDPPDTTPLVRKSAQLGQNLLVPPNVKGWPGYNDWIDATRLLERKRFAEQLFRAMDTMADQQQWAEAFLAGYGGHADREPDAAVQARLCAALLPLPPTQPVAAGTVGVAWLRSLMLDAAYQLK